jgi:hypothetical protein
MKLLYGDLHLHHNFFYTASCKCISKIYIHMPCKCKCKSQNIHDMKCKCVKILGL